MNQNLNFKRSWRENLAEIIFGAETPAGRLFDVVLLWTILLSIACVMLESVASIRIEYGQELRIAEWVFTGLFTLEYIARIVCVDRPKLYIFSFFGVIDLLAIVPTYLSLVIVSSQYLLVVRSIRLLRVFRVLKLVRYVSEANVLMKALSASRHKIIVFLGAVFTTVLIMGTLMFVVEQGENGFTSIPKSMYWAIVTLTTVGYGDIAPQTTLGQAISSLIMVLGYGIIAVPTGIVSAELSRVNLGEARIRKCEKCKKQGQAPDAVYCKYCGEVL
ncbi:MAG: ion transporter [Bdellovibrionota bacterium]